MNRQERRKQEKNLKKNREAINNMTPVQAKITDLVATERANKIANNYIDKFSEILDRCMTAALLDHEIEYNDIEGIQKNMTKMFEEDNIKIEKIKEENIDMAKMELEVKQAIREILKSFTVKKLAIEELTFKFPKLSKSMLTTAYAKVEGEFKEEIYIEIEELSKNSNSEQTINTLINKFGIIKDIASKYYYSWKTEYMAKKETVVTKTNEIIENTIEKSKKQTSVKNEVEAIEMKKLLVLEEKVIKTIKVVGENGTYEAETEKGVILSREGMSISFKSEDELNEWVTEFKQIFKMVV